MGTFVLYGARVSENETLGEYLSELRTNAGLSLRDVETKTLGAVSNVYLSQLETGRRTAPNPRILVALAKVYGVPMQVLFEKAGYLDSPQESEVDVAFEQLRADPSFQFGTRFSGELDEQSKRVIIQLYERATGKKLLPEDGSK